MKPRSTRPRGTGAASLLGVVRRGLQRVAPRSLRVRIRRSMVQRATAMPSRLNCAHTLQTRHPPKLSTCTLAMSTLITSSRIDRFDGGRLFADQ